MHIDYFRFALVDHIPRLIVWQSVIARSRVVRASNLLDGLFQIFPPSPAAIASYDDRVRSECSPKLAERLP